ncbi:MAG: SET domain-containing protein-lysine N-methyltransferase [Saprospiraceae bacterium]|nr:SET domain-containing protein-lysine N-methyltransferase [Saprospiraceae bacterium]
MQIHPGLYIASSDLGDRGVFSATIIPEGAPLEICPVLVLPGTDQAKLDQTLLHDYYFIWGADDSQCALVLGYGSLYNHSYQPNAEYRPDFEGNTLDFYALREIQPGEEITVNYSGDPDGFRKMWFEVK